MRAAIAGIMAVAMTLAACGPRSPSPAPPSPHADGFDPSSIDFERPCTLLRPQDAAAIYDQPFFRTIAADRVENNQVRCSQAIGDGGISGLAEVTVLYYSGEPRTVYASHCAPPPPPAPEPTPPPPAPAPAASAGATAAAPAAPPLTNAAGTTPPPAAPPVAAPPPPPRPQIPANVRMCVTAGGSMALLRGQHLLIVTGRGTDGAPDRDRSQALGVLIARRLGSAPDS